jgi:hypothetical protein
LFQRGSWAGIIQLTASPATPQSLQFYMIAAHLTPRDIVLWRRLAQLSADQGFVTQAIYCLNEVGGQIGGVASELP